MDCPADVGVLSEIGKGGDFEVHPIDVSFSEVARSRLLEILQNDNEDVVLKVAVHRGGCSGYLYDMQVVDKPNGEDHQFAQIEGIPIAISNFDSSLLSGIIIDFEESLMGGGFKIENPNAQRGCSCGKSFA